MSRVSSHLDIQLASSEIADDGPDQEDFLQGRDGRQLFQDGSQAYRGRLL